MADLIYNPWAVANIDSFNFLCCPECVFRSKKASSFQKHAIENHPKSKVFFSAEQKESSQNTIASNEQSNLFYCCPECSYRLGHINPDSH